MSVVLSPTLWFPFSFRYREKIKILSYDYESPEYLRSGSSHRASQDRKACKLVSLLTHVSMLKQYLCSYKTGVFPFKTIQKI